MAITHEAILDVNDVDLHIVFVTNAARSDIVDKQGKPIYDSTRQAHPLISVIALKDHLATTVVTENKGTIFLEGMS